MTARLCAWLRSGCPAVASSWGWCLFQLGLLLLPSTVLLASLLFVPALVLGSLRREGPYWCDRWNWPLLAAGGLMLLSCFSAVRADLAWAGLANWLPFFWGFWGFQPYVAEAGARRRAALWLVAGTVPVVVTGLGQLWLGWQGPWQLLGGLVIWFMAPGGEPEGRLSGLFDYANIAAAWLALVWPLMLAALVQPDSIAVVEVWCRCWLPLGTAWCSPTRNGWGALLLAVPLVLGPVSWPWLLPLLVLALIPVVLAVLPGVPALLQTLPERYARVGVVTPQRQSLCGERALASTRLSQWGVALQLIAERPWLGWGAAAFSVSTPYARANGMVIPTTCRWSWRSAMGCRRRLRWWAWCWRC